MSANDNYEPDTPATEGYESRAGQNEVPVQSDAAPVEEGVDAETADSDAQLARDDEQAIDKDNIIGERTRGAGKPKGTYREPGDDEGLPVEDGSSST